MRSKAEGAMGSEGLSRRVARLERTERETGLDVLLREAERIAADVGVTVDQVLALAEELAERNGPFSPGRTSARPPDGPRPPLSWPPCSG